MTLATLDLSLAKQEAQNRKRILRNILIAGIIYHVVLSLIMLFVPNDLITALLHLPSNVTHTFAMSGLLLLLTTFYRATGAYNVFRWRWPNIIAIVQHLLLALVLLFSGGRLPIFGIVEISLAAITALLFLNYVKAEIMSRP
jgi:hypothetical protein